MLHASEAAIEAACDKLERAALGARCSNDASETAAIKMAAGCTLYRALEPFDDALGEDEPDLPDDTKVTLTFGAVTDSSLTLGDLRRARAAIREADGFAPRGALAAATRRAA